MAAMPPPLSRRPTQRASHLRHVSNGSWDETSSSRPLTAASDTGTGQQDALALSPPLEQRCVLWVHEEKDFKEEVILNLDLLRDIKAGDLVAIVALRTDSGVRDFQDRVSASKKSAALSDTLVPPESSNPSSKLLGDGDGIEIKHDVDPEKEYLFVAKDMPKEMKLKHPSMEVSVVKHVAEAFGLKHRSNVLLTTVSHTLA